MNQFLLHTSWWVPCYGLIGALLTIPWSIGLVRRTGPRPAAYFNIFMTFVAFVHGMLIFQQTWHHEAQQFVFHWLKVADLDLTFTLDISAISVGAMEIVTGLSLLAQLFAIGYMEKDWSLARFFALMGFFEAAISGLALSNSLFLSYALLEMLTLSTYLLVGFWYAQPLVVTAARDAFLTKRVGDILLLMGLVTLASFSGSLDFPALYEWAEAAELSPLAANLLGLSLIAGPIGKCAQFPLHLWLDEAMEGPNPASILRNSVVVSGGAFILIKLQPILNIAPIALDTLVFIGTLTALGASLVAIAQVDIKRALSHSTSAYLGLVFIAVGMQWTQIALMLLFTHGVAKALLFMSAGSVILTTNSQDLTEYGGLGKRMPATMIAFAVGGLALVGIVPLGCFWVFERGLDIFWTEQPLIVGVFLAVNVLSVVSLMRVFRHTFRGDVQPKTRRAPEIPWPMAVPMVSMIIIVLLTPLMMHNLQLLPDWEYLNKFAVLTLTVSGLLGLGIGAVIPLEKSKARSIRKPIRVVQDILAYDFYVDRLYRVTVVFLVDGIAKLTAWFDRYVVDGLVNMVGWASIFSGESLKYSVSGQSQFYVLTILLGVGILGVMLTWTFW
jgi:NAD(P)H-quinone oxidoreductase subunit 5